VSPVKYELGFYIPEDDIASILLFVSSLKTVQVGINFGLKGISAEFIIWSCWYRRK
jgi:hypothetical protein